MKTSANGRKFIAKEEGNILYAYDDATEKRVPAGGTVKGTITIGVGHTSAAGEPKVVPGMTITAEQSDQILANDLGKVEKQVSDLVKVPLNQNQFDALVSFQFNTGGLGKSTTLKKLNAGDYQGAADAMLNWSKANNNPTLLLPRRKRERELFLTPSAAVVPEDKPSTTPKTVGVGTVLVGGVATAAAAPTDYVPWIIAGTFVLALIAFLVIDVISYNKWKKTQNVIV